MSTHPLTQFAAQTPLDVGVGHMLLNIADPLPGHERAYGRWYEDDHFAPAAMMAPFVFAGRRWLAPASVRTLQYARPGGEFDGINGGSSAATYWIAPGHLNDYFAWAAGTGPQLDAQGRNFSERRLIFVSFADHAGSVYRDESVPRDIFTLMDPPGAMVVQFIDAPDAASRAGLARWLLAEALPERLAMPDASAHTALVFHGAADTSAMRPALQDLQRRADNDGRRLIVLWFLDSEPQRTWETEFVTLPAFFESRADVEWTAPFIPARMGTDQYVDQLQIE